SLSPTSVTDFSPDAGLSVAVRDGSGGAIILWNDMRDSGTTGTDVYAQHVVMSGGFAVDPAWPASGVPVSTAADNQWMCGGGNAVSDGAGGVLASWTDLRDQFTQGFDIYAQRVTASGALPTDPVASITGPLSGATFPINTPVTFSGTFTDN